MRETYLHVTIVCKEIRLLTSVVHMVSVSPLLKLPALYKTLLFMTVFTTASRLCLSRTSEWSQYTHFQLLKTHYYILLPSTPKYFE